MHFIISCYKFITNPFNYTLQIMHAKNVANNSKENAYQAE